MQSLGLPSSPICGRHFSDVPVQASGRMARYWRKPMYFCDGITERDAMSYIRLLVLRSCDALPGESACGVRAVLISVRIPDNPDTVCKL